MTRRIDIALAATVMVAACAKSNGDARPSAASRDSSSAATVANSAAGRITFRGLDSVRLGETAAEYRRSTGEPLAIRVAEEPACRYLRPRALPSGVKVMVANDTVVRLDVDSGRVTTDRGVAIGTPDSVVRAAYGPMLSVAPNKYLPAPAHDLVVTDADDTLRRLVFESDGAKVTRYRVGVRPAVDLVEGCG